MKLPAILEFLELAAVHWACACIVISKGRVDWMHAPLPTFPPLFLTLKTRYSTFKVPGLPGCTKHRFGFVSLACIVILMS